MEQMMANFGPWQIREGHQQKIKAFSLELVKSKIKSIPKCQFLPNKKPDIKILPPLRTPTLRPRVCLTEEDSESLQNDRVYNFIKASNRPKKTKIKYLKKKQEKYNLKQHVYPDVLIQASSKHSKSFARMREIRKEAACQRQQIFRIWNAFKPYKVKRRDASRPLPIQRTLVHQIL